MLNSSLLVLGCSIIFAVSAGMPLHAASSEKKENKTVASEDALPSLALDGLPDVWIQGTPVKEWEKDKVYIFEFWATWCGPCLAAMPHMEQLHQAFKNNPHMQVIGVNVMDRKSPESLKEFLRNRPSPLMPWPWMWMGKKPGINGCLQWGLTASPMLLPLKTASLFGEGILENFLKK